MSERRSGGSSAGLVGRAPDLQVHGLVAGSEIRAWAGGVRRRINCGFGSAIHRRRRPRRFRWTELSILATPPCSHEGGREQGEAKRRERRGVAGVAGATACAAVVRAV